tara:strand:- start:1168 stop:1563 length:396 start_codon:yes stop_codon:yes gene_type:complete
MEKGVPRGEDDPDVKAATEAVEKKSSQRIFTEVLPELDKLSLKYTLTKNKKGIRFNLGPYKLSIGLRTGERYTMTIWSKTKNTEEALSDFPNSQELSPHGSVDSSRQARIPMSDLSTILESIRWYVKKVSA